MATMQEVFEKVAKHLLSQKMRAKSSLRRRYTECAYRGTDGTKCAIGCLIEDRFYKASMEGLRARHPDIIHAVIYSGNYPSNTKDDTIFFFEALQRVHDLEEVSNWQMCLKAIAAEFKLDGEFLNGF